MSPLLLLLLVLLLLPPSNTFTPSPKPTPPRSLASTSPSPDIQKTLSNLYTTSLNIKCPFFRRRAHDLLDSTTLTLKFLASRHRSIFPDFVYLVAPGSEASSIPKVKNLSILEIKSLIEHDWSQNYYVTGLLSTQIYRDDTLFTSPDPDMPVRGLRKYISASRNLFTPTSTCTLLKIEIKGDNIEVDWRLEGVLRVPWRPKVWGYEGRTVYRRDEEGLIFEHRCVLGFGGGFFLLF
ncbi:hypothetical protein TL16_g02462 [Triparma laevis f. inornata]|uniref:Uncharacterized protein n=1 Tax=Triparma laevis f. inornata TaxID=1714386 RepID=A0A9W6ZST9_9STRA|nr:hypothetical protein TL16_g02462 [Triparma laevis f. inornata]